MVDEKKAAEDIPLANTQKGGIFLGAGWKPDAWSQRNLADDVYDAVLTALRSLPILVRMPRMRESYSPCSIQDWNTMSSVQRMPGKLS